VLHAARLAPQTIIIVPRFIPPNHSVSGDWEFVGWNEKVVSGKGTLSRVWMVEVRP